MESHEILERGLAIIENPKRWTTGTLERGIFRKQYCALGALRLGATSAGMDEYNQAVHLLAKQIKPVPEYWPVGWPDTDAEFVVWSHNDMNGHDAIVQAFKAAIAEAKAPVMANEADLAVAGD